MGRKGGSHRGDDFDGRVTISRLIVESVHFARPICLDTTAVIAYLEDTAVHADFVAPILEHPRVPVVISTISLCEVLTGYAKLHDELTMRRIARRLARYSRLTIIPFDDSVAHRAAIVRVATGLKLPDAGVVATGLMASAIAIVGNDARWRSKPLGLPYIHLGDLVSAN